MICLTDPARQRPRLLVDGIAELLDRAPHAFARLRPNIRAVVEDARNRDPRDTGRLRDVVDGGVALHRARRLASVLPVRNGRMNSACQHR